MLPETFKLLNKVALSDITILFSIFNCPSKVLAPTSVVFPETFKLDNNVDTS